MIICGYCGCRCGYWRVLAFRQYPQGFRRSGAVKHVLRVLAGIEVWSMHMWARTRTYARTRVGPPINTRQYPQSLQRASDLHKHLRVLADANARRSQINTRMQTPQAFRSSAATD